MCTFFPFFYVLVIFFFTRAGQVFFFLPMWVKFFFPSMCGSSFFLFFLFTFEWVKFFFFYKNFLLSPLKSNGASLIVGPALHEELVTPTYGKGKDSLFRRDKRIVSCSHKNGFIVPWDMRLAFLRTLQRKEAVS